MKRLFTVTCCVVFLGVCITLLISRSSTAAHAQEICAIPKAFGTLRTSIMTALVFEAPDGTIRFLNFEQTAVGERHGSGCPTIMMAVQRR